MVTLYTIQNVEVVKSLTEEHVIKENPDYVWDFFVKPYDWMKIQLGKKLNRDVDSLIWFWDVKPDLNEEGHLKAGEKGVLIEVNIPEDKVLFSNFDAWHSVLNDFYLILNEKEENLLDSGKLPLSKEGTWERMFDLDLIKNSEYFEAATDNQVVAEKVKLEWVRNIVYFNAN